jgi:hypothetical protein
MREVGKECYNICYIKNILSKKKCRAKVATNVIA